MACADRRFDRRHLVGGITFGNFPIQPIELLLHQRTLPAELIEVIGGHRTVDGLYGDNKKRSLNHAAL